MRHQSLDQISTKANVTQAQPAMSRQQRLHRWAELLERNPDRPLRALSWVEFYHERERGLLRGDGTPISVAFSDPVLREQGLQGDTLGHAQAFFDLSSREAHFLLCDCHYLGRMDSAGVAKRIRAVASPSPFRQLRVALFGD
jgi:hypothetical protein